MAERWRGAHTAWFSAGLVLTAATALRPGDLPLGVGEVLLGTWTIASLPSIRGNHVPNPFARAFFLFWIPAVCLLAAGWMAAQLLVVSTPKAWHDAGAFGFLVASVGTFVLLPGLETRTRQAIRWLMLFSVIPLMALLCLFYLSAGNPLVPTERFVGWSRNPNALGFLVVLVPFLSLIQLREATTRRDRRLAKVFFAGALLIGIASQSDALIFAWSLGALLVILGRRSAVARGARWQIPAALALVVGLAVLLTPSFDGEVPEGNERLDQGGQIGDRVSLWIHGIEAVTASPIVGLGPGPHSGVSGPHQGSEAHNALIDWTASTGLVGLLLLMGFFIFVARWVFLSRDNLLAASLVALIVLGMFHYYLRHPLVWFGLLSIAILARAEVERRSRSRQRGPAALQAPSASRKLRFGRPRRVPGMADPEPQGLWSDGAH